jgi:ribosomal protein S18 acetylase RimI-like enzyme
MEALYAAAAIGRFAAWVHETDRAMRDELRRRGYTVDTTTRAMGMPLDGVSLPRPEIELAPPAWQEHVRLIGAPSALLGGLDPAALHLLVARHDGENVATAFGFDHDGDCGIYDVGTLAHARRRGIGTALTSALVHDAIARGCQTASLQATPMAERMYAAVGFRDLDRIVEYVPSPR